MAFSHSRISLCPLSLVRLHAITFRAHLDNMGNLPISRFFLITSAKFLLPYKGNIHRSKGLGPENISGCHFSACLFFLLLLLLLPPPPLTSLLFPQTLCLSHYNSGGVGHCSKLPVALSGDGPRLGLLLCILIPTSAPSSPSPSIMGLGPEKYLPSEKEEKFPKY